MIGLSVSFCIRDIIDGKVKLDDVEMIYGATRAVDNEAWKRVSAIYQQAYWVKNPELGNAILWELLAQNKIMQPRLLEGYVPDISQGIWVDSKAEIRDLPGYRELSPKPTLEEAFGSGGAEQIRAMMQSLREE